MPLSADQLHETVAQVGFALWQIQILEGAVGSYLVLVHQASPAVARSEVESMFAKTGKSTLGQLLRAIQATHNPPESLVEQLDAFVPKRNWLVHHSRHESHAEMYSGSHRMALMARIARIADDALILMKAFQAATETHLVALGVPKEQIDRDAARILRQWTAMA